MVIGAGHKTYGLLLDTSKYQKNNCKSIAILAPTFKRDKFDIICSPIHDNNKLKDLDNVIFYEGSLSKVSLKETDNNTVMVAIGGKNKHYQFNEEYILSQIDYFISPHKNHHLMFTGGILEDMFSGLGFEYLYFKNDTNYSLGFELFSVTKRDYDWGFGTLDYQNITGHVNLHYRNYGLIPFDMKLSYGEYLAGDIGTTIEFSRTYNNGMIFGVFASNTDVSEEQFGEGSFDKGIFFNIPIYGNLVNYTWRPLTKDPGAKLIRRNTLHNLLVKFQPIN